MILLVEDKPSNIYVIHDYLAVKGYQVIVAHNGEEALSILNQVEPDIILMDIHMPEMDGIEATTRIRQMPTYQAIPIIAVTALAMPEDRNRIMEAGIDHYLSKPIELKKLGSMIEEVLRG